MNLELIGKKLGMSQVYDEDNNLVPVTIVEAGPCPILQVKSTENDGYEAIQIGFNPKGKSPNKPNKCQVGKAKKANVEPQHLSQEIRLNCEHSFEQGGTLTVENFSDVKMVDVISTTKGKGFQGLLKGGISAEVLPFTARCSIVGGDPMVCVSGLVAFLKIRRCLGILAPQNAQPRTFN